MGTVTLGMAVARQVRRKTNTTAVTRKTLRMSVISTSSTEARMVPARSTATCVLIAGEMFVAIDGRSALTRSIVWMMFAPGCRRMMTTTARVPSAHPATRPFSTSSNTLATSESRTVVPLL